MATGLTAAIDQVTLCPCTQARAQVCEACKATVLLDKHISDAEKVLRDLKAKRPQFRGIINATHDSLTSKLPPEVVSNIFMKFVEAPPSDPLSWMQAWDKEARKSQELQWIPPLDPQQNGDAVNSPFQLGSICRAWRRIAWATPQIWAGIGLDIGHKNLNKRHVERLEACLANSQNTPLRIEISMDKDAWYRYPLLAPGKKTYVMELLGILRSHSSRWIELYTFLPDKLGSFIHCDASAPSKLKRLHITGDSNITSGIDIKNAEWDCLTHVKMWASRLRKMVKVIWKWDNMTHVDIEFLCIPEVLKVLTCAPHLTHFKVSISDFKHGDHSGLNGELPFVAHHHLKYFYVGNSYNDIDISLICRKTAFPTLDELVYFVPSKLDSVQIGFMPSFISGLNNLKRLTLEFIGHYRNDRFMSVFKTLFTLEYLELSIDNFDEAESPDSFLKALADFPPKPEDVLLPKLVELCIRMSPPISFNLIPPIFGMDTAQPHIALINTRRWRPLHNISVQFGMRMWRGNKSGFCDLEHLDVEVVSILLPLCNRGVTLRLSSNRCSDLMQASLELYRSKLKFDQ